MQHTTITCDGCGLPIESVQYPGRTFTQLQNNTVSMSQHPGHPMIPILPDNKKLDLCDTCYQEVKYGIDAALTAISIKRYSSENNQRDIGPDSPI